MTISAFMIAGTHSGCGKTTVSLGIMAALARRGLTVQPFKVGPDFIDPGHHQRVATRDSHNLDGWMMDRERNRRIFSRYIADADVAVVEGVMGLFDGFSGSDESGSTAQMAKWLGLPVVLVIDASSMAGSAAAVVLGFRSLDPSLNLAGVVFNKLGSVAHGDMIMEAMGKKIPDLPVLGRLPRKHGLQIPSRHLGLVTAEDLGMHAFQVDELARWIEEGIDLNTMLAETRWHGMPGNMESHAGNGRLPADRGKRKGRPVRIGIARDEAFCFYYRENIRLLEESGAEMVPFSPLSDLSLIHI